jgi:hypothetical protein
MTEGIHERDYMVRVLNEQPAVSGRLFFLLKIFVEQISQIIFGDETHKLLNHISFRIQKVELGLVVKTEGALEFVGLRIVGIKVRKLDSAKILCFEPMNHGRHGAARTSGKAEEFNKLQSARSQADRCGICGFQVWAAGGGNGLHGNFRGDCLGCFRRSGVCWCFGSGNDGRWRGLRGRLFCLGWSGRSAGNGQLNSDQAHGQEKEAGFH